VIDTRLPKTINHLYNHVIAVTDPQLSHVVIRNASVYFSNATNYYNCVCSTHQVYAYNCVESWGPATIRNDVIYQDLCRICNKTHSYTRAHIHTCAHEHAHNMLVEKYNVVVHDKVYTIEINYCKQLKYSMIYIAHTLIKMNDRWQQICSEPS
jgi:hypothetical protein